MEFVSNAVSLVVLAALVIIVIAIISAPLRIIFKLIINTIVGFVTLLLINFLGGFVGISIAVTWLNALIAGIFGVPGIAVLLILRWLSIT